MASLTNCWPTDPFLLRVTRERWAIRLAVRFWRMDRFLLRVTPGQWAIRPAVRTDRFLLRVIQGQWAILPAVRSCRLGSNRSFCLIVILPGNRLQALEPGNVT
jgi:hypothetical protein